MRFRILQYQEDRGDMTKLAKTIDHSSSRKLSTTVVCFYANIPQW